MEDCPSLYRLLVVGEEGDFSFSNPLANAFEDIAASLDSQEQLLREHGLAAASDIQSLRPRGGVLIYAMDASRMAEHVVIHSALTFNRVLYNFPHAGSYEKEVIMKHRYQLERFFANASKLLSPGGEVHVYHKESKARKRSMKRQAERSGLMLKAASDCDSCHVPGYPCMAFVSVLNPSLSKYSTGLTKHTTGQAVVQKKLCIECKEGPATTDGWTAVQEPFPQEKEQLCGSCRLPLGIGMPLAMDIPVVKQTNVAQQHVHSHDFGRAKAHPPQYPSGGKRQRLCAIESNWWRKDPQDCTAANAKSQPPNGGGGEKQEEMPVQQGDGEKTKKKKKRQQHQQHQKQESSAVQEEWKGKSHPPQRTRGKRPCRPEIESSWWRKTPEECPEGGNAKKRQPLQPLESNAVGVEQKQQSEGKTLIEPTNARGGEKQQSQEKEVPVRQGGDEMKTKKKRRHERWEDAATMHWGRGKGKRLRLHEAAFKRIQECLDDCRRD